MTEQDLKIQELKELNKSLIEENNRLKNAMKHIINRVEELKDSYEHSCIDNTYQRGAGDGAKWFKTKALEIIKEELV